MKRKLLIFISIMAMSLFVACSDDDGGGVVPIGGFNNPGIFLPNGGFNNPGIFLPNDGFNHNKIIWQSDTRVSVSNQDDLARLIHRKGSPCLLDGWYFGIYQAVLVGQDCKNFNKGVDIAFAINKDNGNVELYLKAYYNNSIWTEYSRQIAPSTSCGGGGLCANFGTTYPIGQILDKEIGSQVEVFSSASGNINDFEQMETIDIEITYDNRSIGTFNLHRAN